MSTTEVTPHLTDPVTFWQSTNGKKVVMAVTGVMMFGFVVGHMLGNLQMFEAPEHINAYGHFLHSLGELLVDRARRHAAGHRPAHYCTIQLALRSKAARPVGYSRKEAINSSYASRTMYWSGPIVLAFIIFHLLQFTAGYIHPAGAIRRGRCLPQRGRRLPGLVGFAVVHLCYLPSRLHLSHGLWSMFQSVGLAHPRISPTSRTPPEAIALLIVLGYISIPDQCVCWGS
jgi:succinate dehydrogenase / fumarate reductase cytochrome b subunit